MGKVIIVGATSGIGLEIARLFINKGDVIGLAARREDLLLYLKQQYPSSLIQIQKMDVTQDSASDRLRDLIKKTGGLDLFLLCAGIGYQNISLEQEKELNTVATNAAGFTRMVTTAFDYFKESGGGHLAVITSIAGTKGLGAAPAYSATKRFQNTYLDALSQLSQMQKLNIRITDIRPGFVNTPLLDGARYPMLMKPDRVAKCIVKALEKKKRVVVIDWRYHCLVIIWKLIPRWLWERLPIHS